MDAVSNPYTPNAGARPPELAGREEVMDAFSTLLDRVAEGRTDKGLIMTGLRGVGKTVLLTVFEDFAIERHMVVIKHEASKTPGTFSRSVPLLMRSALLQISPQDRWKERGHRAAGVIAGFKAQFDPSGTWSLGFDPTMASSVAGVADSGDLTADLPDMLVALGHAAAEHERVVVILVDEIQFLNQVELSALVMAKHRINQYALPVVLGGAGLPQLPSITAQAQTYAERMFTWPELGPLPPSEARTALLAPAEASGRTYETTALDYILEQTEGYPFFLQEYGKAAWNIADRSPITLDDAQRATPVVDAVLDQDFFALRIGPLPKREVKYIQALAALGPGAHAPAAVARGMGLKSSSTLGSAAARLVERGVIYNTRRGQVAFTVPHFDQYVLRAFT